MTSLGEDVEDFMDGPLIIWLKSCLEDSSALTDYNDLVDGVLLYQILLQIDPEPSFTGVVPSQGNPLLRVRNLDILLKNLRSLYQEEFGQIVIMVPNVVRLGIECNSVAAKSDLTQLLLLLLACAVQCPNKEIFIERIKLLPIDVQHAIVDYIKQFTDTPLMVLGLEQDASVSNDILLSHVRHLVKERDEFLARWASAASVDPAPAATHSPRKVAVAASTTESHHLAVELADWKSKLRKQRQELEEKTEALNECRDELDQERSLVSRLRQEIADVMQDARSAKAYRDELDAMREKAERAEKLETELDRLKAKLRDVEFFKTRVEELRDDNRLLMETREMLEDQLTRARKRGDRMLELETEILQLKQHANELTLERDAKDRKLEELYAEQAELQMLARSALKGKSGDNCEEVSGPEETGDNSLSSQLSNNATTRALRLELENHRLRSTIETLQESTFHEASAKLLDSERENKRLTLNMSQIDEQNKRLTTENKELEALVKDALQESRKLQEVRDNLRTAADAQQNELQTVREQLEDMKTHVDVLQEEKAKLVAQLEELEQKEDALSPIREEAALVPNLRRELEDAAIKIDTAEQQIASLQKEVSRLKDAIEEKNVQLDEISQKSEINDKEKEHLIEELKSARTVSVKLHEVEREREEIASRAAVAEEALSALQAELVANKVECQQLKTGLDKLGLSSDLLLDPCITLANLLTSPALRAQLPAELQQECQNCRELVTLQADNARLQVSVATFHSQITSLTAQHTAVQLANTQLVAEKDQLEEERRSERSAHEQLLSDQTSLRQLHEQLTSEHELLLQKQEALKQTLREKQREIQGLRDQVRQQEVAQADAKANSDSLNEKTESLKNLRLEHSNLKADFRAIFTSHLKLKEEYQSMQAEYKQVRMVGSDLYLRNAELMEEITSLTDNVNHLQLQLDTLTQANRMLEEDRRSVMDHASTLLAQYQELFTHSLEDNQHYHAEEKQFADKLNELRRQKEKLEEKIMDQYRKLDSTSNKKKGFGTTLVRKMRKAGSDLINRSRRSLHEDSRASLNIHGSESGENESDGSLEDSRQEDGGPLPNILNQQGAGTRQTVYEGPGSAEGTPTLYVINRLTNTTMVGVQPSPPSPSLSLRSQTEENKRKPKKENIYFDYGCV